MTILLTTPLSPLFLPQTKGTSFKKNQWSAFFTGSSERRNTIPILIAISEVHPPTNRTRSTTAGEEKIRIRYIGKKGRRAFFGNRNLSKKKKDPRYRGKLARKTPDIGHMFVISTTTDKKVSTKKTQPSNYPRLRVFDLSSAPQSLARV